MVIFWVKLIKDITSERFVLKKSIVITAFLSIIIAISGISPVFASSQLEVTIDPNSDTAIAKMT